MLAKTSGNLIVSVNFWDKSLDGSFQGGLRKHASEDFRKSDKRFEEVLDTKSDQSVKPRNCKIKQV